MANIYPMLSQLSKRNSNDNALLCSICKQVPVDVVDSKCCASLFCWECAANADTCPNCNVKVQAGDFRANVPIQRIIDTMEFPCGYDCGAIITASERVTHELICPNKPIVCSYSENCGLIPRGNYEFHLDNCPYRDYFCRCGVVLPFIESEEHLSTFCGLTEVPCPHGCDEKIERRFLQKHINEDCQNTPVLCEFSEHGCNFAPLKSEYQQHLDENVHIHLSLMNKIVKKQAQEIEELKKRRNEPPTVDINQVIGNFKESSRHIAQSINDSPCFHKTCQFLSEAVPKAFTVARSIANQLALRHAIEMLLSLIAFTLFIPDFFIFLIMFYSYPRAVWQLGRYGNVEKSIRWMILAVSATISLCSCSFLVFLISFGCLGVIVNRFAHVVLKQ